jgi:hypothetical protein
MMPRIPTITPLLIQDKILGEKFEESFIFSGSKRLMTRSRTQLPINMVLSSGI